MSAAEGTLKTQGNMPEGGDGHVTLPVMIQIANPGAVFVAALLPAVLSMLFAWEAGAEFRVPLVIALLLIPVFANTSVNFLNDYFDFKRGNDRVDEHLKSDDAPLAYYNIRYPKPVLFAGMVCFAAALVLGVYVVACSGVVPAVIGAVGAVTLIVYSAGRIPVSYLPVGELVSGFVLGGLVPLGVFSGLTGYADMSVLWKSVPMMLTVAHFMLVNNTCDIERDTAAGRKTMPILAGRQAARKVTVVLVVIWVAQLLQITLTWYRGGFIIVLAALLLASKSLIAMCRSGRTPDTRTQDVMYVAGAAFAIAIGYPLSVLAHLIITG